MFDLETDERYMRIALREAEKAASEDEVPVGCIIVFQGRIIGKAHNLREKLVDPTAHAEILAITQAAEALGGWRLLDTTLYVTLEPCPMCAGAIVNARVPRLVYGVSDPKAGAVRTLFNIADNEKLNHRATVTEGILGDECREILQVFFKNKRAGGTISAPD